MCAFGRQPRTFGLAGQPLDPHALPAELSSLRGVLQQHLNDVCALVVRGILER